MKRFISLFLLGIMLTAVSLGNITIRIGDRQKVEISSICIEQASGSIWEELGSEISATWDRIKDFFNATVIVIIGDDAIVIVGDDNTVNPDDNGDENA